MNEKKIELEGELSVIESEIAKLEDNLRPLKERRKAINNQLATMEEEGDDLGEIVRILGKYSAEEINTALNKKVWDKDRFKFDD